MKTVEKKLTAVTASGVEMEIEIVITRGYEEMKKVINDDGYEITKKITRPIHENKMTVKLSNGLTVTRCYLEIDRFVPAELKKKGIYHCIRGYEVKSGNGCCIGIGDEVYKNIFCVEKEATVEAETDENWQKYIELKNKKEKENEEYYKHVKNIANKMTLNGRSM